jgi:acyl-CoA synthetase (NDP forming)/RimJ/RimL family protein N-acetyltransferase
MRSLAPVSASPVEDPPGYPREWEADILLTDGGTAHLRPIRPSDAERLVAFYDRVSPESKYLRFFAPYPRLSERDVRRFTQVDYVDRLALIVTLGEEMIAVGRYDRTEDGEAEVAFLIEDAHQGRGIGQLLLEHLAEAARERGITKFVAEVLPQNRRMAQVFADAGYRVSKGIEDGVLAVEFPILPTDTFVGVMERREHRAERASVERLLTPHRIVVYGKGDRVQGLVNAILGGGHRGEVVAVCSDECEAVGVPTAPSLAEITGQLDLALVSVPTAADLGEVVIDVAHKGAHGIVVLTGNDVRSGDNHTVINLARAYGIRALGPDALGLINTAVDLNATPGPMPRKGGVGLFCQSAAVGVAVLNHAVRSDLGVSSFISTGDYADVTANDVMQYWEDDAATRVCLLSLDSIGNPRKFSRITRRLTRRKPVVVFAPGRTSRAAHSGVRGGLGHAPEEAVDALFRQAGVMVVHRRSAMIDVAKIAARQPLPSGPRVRIVTNSVTLAAQMTQTIEAVGLLRDPAPVLLSSAADPAAFAEAARAALADPAYDSVVCAAVNVFEQGTEDVIWALNDVAVEAGKPLVGVFLDFHPPLTSGATVDEPGHLPRFDAAADAIYALSALSAYAHWRDRDPGAVPLLEGVDEVAAHRVVNEVLAETPQGRELTEAEISSVLGAFGIALVPRFPVETLEEAVEVAERLGWHVALKATAPAVRGRPDLANVYRNIDTAAEMADAWRDLGHLVTDLGLASDSGLSAACPVVQPMAPPGVSLVVTSREDAAFGPIVSLGLDGIPSELLGDTVYRVPPLTTVDASAMVRDLKAAPVLFGRHGTPGVDIAGIEDLLHRVAQLADTIPQLASVTLSPCIASLNSISVLGARVLIAPTANRRDPLTRTL